MLQMKGHRRHLVHIDMHLKIDIETTSLAVHFATPQFSSCEFVAKKAEPILKPVTTDLLLYS